MNSSERRFAELLSLALDGACSDAEREEFARLERENPQLVVECVDTIFTHSLLQWQSEDISECMTLELAASAREDACERAAAHSARFSPRQLWMAVAVMLVVAVGIGVWRMAPPRSAPNEPIAEIVAQSGVTWTSDSTALKDGHRIVPGRLQNKTGSFALQFNSGPTVRIVGPASLNIESAMLVYLDRGQATARVPESSKGFAIKTPVARVVDQGTEFGVAARDDGRTDVIVFEGRVDVRETAGDLPESKSLVMGEAARIDDQGSIDRIMQVNRDSKGGWWTIDRPSSSESVIKRVRDNIPTNNGSKYFCYQITCRGLADDVLAYPDHPHQWNGLTEQGLPEFLRGADYVKTFNNYRYLNDFEMVIELSQPANLYIFFDDRVPAPEWLESQFQETQFDIGLDEGPWVGLPVPRPAWAPERAFDVGSGKSVDTIFSVWHRRCLDTSPVTLGPVNVKNNPSGRAMYGIAATPLVERRPATDAVPDSGGI